VSSDRDWALGDGSSTAHLDGTHEAPAAENADRSAMERAFGSLSRRLTDRADLDEISVGAYRANPQGEIFEANPALAHILGYPSAAALVRLNVQDLYVDPPDSERGQGLIEREAYGEGFEVRLRQFDSRPLYAWTSTRVVRGADGALRYYEGIVKNITRRKQAEDDLRKLSRAVEQQAKRIAQTLHDEAGQLVTAAHLALADVGRDLSPPLRERLVEARGHLDQIEDQLRRLAHELRPRILDDLGLVPALKFLAEGVEKRRRISIAVIADLQKRLPPMVETTLYFLVQEALTNVTKHARASRVTIALEQEPRTLRCIVKDDGIGFDACAVVARLGEHGLGLTGICDRIEALGGTFQINSAPGLGTELVIKLSLET
jgi:PAS domain S-box-containing protein